MNIFNQTIPEENVAEFFRILGQPVRVQILLTIGRGEACVCHLEAYLGLRQAAISQHLMVLRDAGLVTTNRDGRNIFYRLAMPELLEVVKQAARIIGILPGELESSIVKPVFPCPCPHCNPEKADGLDCSQMQVVP
jgi:ArsR family transcriptional regulator